MCAHTQLNHGTHKRLCMPLVGRLAFNCSCSVSVLTCICFCAFDVGMVSLRSSGFSCMVRCVGVFYWLLAPLPCSPLWLPEIVQMCRLMCVY